MANRLLTVHGGITMAKKKKAPGKQERVNTLFDNISTLSKIIGEESNWVMGIDPGRTSPGIAFQVMHADSQKPIVEKFSINTKLKGFGKVIEVESWFLQHIQMKHPGFIVMEDYSFDSEYGREKAGEMGGVLKRAIWLRSIPLITVAPQSDKAFIGVMKKEEIMKEVLRKWLIDTSKSDEADAIVLAKIGAGIAKLVRAGIMIADNDERKEFEASAHKFVSLEQQEAKTLVNLLINRGDTVYEYARGKEKAREAQRKQKQTKGRTDSSNKASKKPNKKTSKKASGTTS